jgi:1-deoxy-D-xylulose-5-phosphate synthase
LQRDYDRVVHDVALQTLQVPFAINRARLVSADGVSHTGGIDNAYLVNLPGVVVMVAAGEVELVHIVATAAAYDAGPIAFRYPHGEGEGVNIPRTEKVLKIGTGRKIETGTRVTIFYFGTRLSEVLKADETLRAPSIAPMIADAQFAKPLDHALILQLAKTHEALITIEGVPWVTLGVTWHNSCSIKGALTVVLYFVPWCYQTCF